MPCRDAEPHTSTARARVRGLSSTRAVQPLTSRPYRARVRVAVDTHDTNEETSERAATLYVLCTPAARSRSLALRPHGLSIKEGKGRRGQQGRKKKGDWARRLGHDFKTDMRTPRCCPPHGSFPPRTCGGSLIGRPQVGIVCNPNDVLCLFLTVFL